MSGRRMKVRKCKDGSLVIRIYHLHEDQIKTIQLALEIARSESQSDFDSVAIDGICMSFISSGAAMPTQKLSVHDSNVSKTAAPTASDVQVLSDAATAAFLAYSKAWDAAYLPKMMADIEAGEAAISKFIEGNNASVKLKGSK
jgi:hypothetical protein